MEGARATWTDERLDDLSRRVDDGFNRVDERLRGLDARIDAQGMEVSRRIDGLQRTTIQVGGGTIVTALATLATVIART
jgi:hypothetical protein